MASTTPIAITIIGAALIAIASLVWRRQKSQKLEGTSNERERPFFAQWIIGVVLSLMAATFMFDGHIVGENTAGIWTVIGIAGISLIAATNVNLLSLKRKWSNLGNQTQVTTQNSAIIQSSHQERGHALWVGRCRSLKSPGNTKVPMERPLAS